MRKSFVALMLVACLFVGNTGCAFVTKGDASWEVYGGVRTTQKSEEPASIGIVSPVIERMIDNLTDGEATEVE